MSASRTITNTRPIRAFASLMAMAVIVLAIMAMGIKGDHQHRRPRYTRNPLGRGAIDHGHRLVDSSEHTWITEDDEDDDIRIETDDKANDKEKRGEDFDDRFVICTMPLTKPLVDDFVECGLSEKMAHELADRTAIFEGSLHYKETMNITMVMTMASSCKHVLAEGIKGDEDEDDDDIDSIVILLCALIGSASADCIKEVVLRAAMC